MSDSEFKVIYLGGDAGDHSIDMRQLGTSLIGVDKLVSDVVVTLSARRLPKRGERASFVMKAREPIAGSVEVPAILQDAAGLLPLGWQVLQTAGPDLIWNWLKAVISYHGGDKEDAQQYLDAMLELSRQAHEARDRADLSRERDLERHMQENREWRAMLETLIERSQPAAAQAVAPVGASVTQMRIVAGGRNVDISTPTADKIKAGDKLDIRPMREMIVRVDGFTFHDRKLSIGTPNEAAFWIQMFRIQFSARTKIRILRRPAGRLGSGYLLSQGIAGTGSSNCISWSLSKRSMRRHSCSGMR